MKTLLLYGLFVIKNYLLVTLPGLSRRICSLVGLNGVLDSGGSSLVAFFLGCSKLKFGFDN